MPRKKGVPAYRRRIIRGREIAVVTLYDAGTGRRRDVWLGDYGSPESRGQYARVLAKWEESGRRLPGPRPPIRAAAGPTTTEVVAAYWEAISARGYSASHTNAIRCALRRWRAHFGRFPAAEITPVLLRDWRATIAQDISVDRAVRSTVVVLAMYRWAVSYDLVPVEVYQRLKTVEPLRHPPRQPVGPAPMEAVNAVRQHVTSPVRAMIDLQLLTGMRPGEVCALRPCDLTCEGHVWTYRPATHKTAHHGHRRTIYLGPAAQGILGPFLAGRPMTAYCFSPVESMQEIIAARHKARVTPLSCGNRPGTNRKPEPCRRPGCRYTTTSYARAVVRACIKAGVARWHPHQLRHNYATEVRKRYGLEAARILLGHSSALVAEAVDAERVAAEVTAWCIRCYSDCAVSSASTRR